MFLVALIISTIGFAFYFISKEKNGLSTGNSGLAAEVEKLQKQIKEAEERNEKRGRGVQQAEWAKIRKEREDLAQNLLSEMDNTLKIPSDSEFNIAHAKALLYMDLLSISDLSQEVSALTNDQENLSVLVSKAEAKARSYPAA